MWTNKPVGRKRKVKAPCAGCGLHLDLCICSSLRSLDLKTRLTLIIHRREVQKPTNTGMLATKMLKNSQMLVRGEIGKPLDLTCCLTPEYQTLLLYPSEGAQELTSDFLSSIRRPIHLLVPDGSWRQASKVHYRHKEICHVPRVIVAKLDCSMDKIRKETKDQGMATLHAISLAMGKIEGKEVAEALYSAFEQKLQNIMQSRGHRKVIE